MPYKHDIFLSYLHDDQMGPWVQQHLVPFINSFIGNALNRPINCFIDRKGILTGDSWPLRLQSALAHSRCLVAVWSPLYFHSLWCRRECAAMLYREKRAGYRTITRPRGLVAPINVFDGEFFPDSVQDIQWLDCKRYWIVGDAFTKTERYVEFQDALRVWATEIAKMIAGAPHWQADWTTKKWFNVPDNKLRPKAAKNFEFTGLE